MRTGPSKSNKAFLHSTTVFVTTVTVVWMNCCFSQCWYFPQFFPRILRQFKVADSEIGVPPYGILRVYVTLFLSPNVCACFHLFAASLCPG